MLVARLVLWALLAWPSVAMAVTVNPKAVPYRARGDGQVATDCSMTSGSAELTCATNHFVARDAGKVIAVYGAGPMTGGLVQPLSTTIAAYVDAKHVTLAAKGATSVINSERVVWGTNDTASIQAAVDALANVGG